MYCTVLCTVLCIVLYVKWEAMETVWSTMRWDTWLPRSTVTSGSPFCVLLNAAKLHQHWRSRRRWRWRAEENTYVQQNNGKRCRLFTTPQRQSDWGYRYNRTRLVSKPLLEGVPPRLYSYRFSKLDVCSPFSLRNHPDFTAKSPRFHFEITSISPPKDRITDNRFAQWCIPPQIR